MFKKIHPCLLAIFCLSSCLYTNPINRMNSDDYYLNVFEQNYNEIEYSNNTLIDSYFDGISNRLDHTFKTIDSYATRDPSFVIKYNDEYRNVFIYRNSISFNGFDYYETFSYSIRQSNFAVCNGKLLLFDGQYIFDVSNDILEPISSNLIKTYYFYYDSISCYSSISFDGKYLHIYVNTHYDETTSCNYMLFHLDSNMELQFCNSKNLKIDKTFFASNIASYTNTTHDYSNFKVIDNKKAIFLNGQYCIINDETETISFENKIYLNNELFIVPTINNCYFSSFVFNDKAYSLEPKQKYEYRYWNRGFKKRILVPTIFFDFIITENSIHFSIDVYYDNINKPVNRNYYFKLDAINNNLSYYLVDGIKYYVGCIYNNNSLIMQSDTGYLSRNLRSTDNEKLLESTYKHAFLKID